MFRNVGIKIQTPGNYLEGSTQHTYNLTSRRFRATGVAVEKQYVLHILSVCCSLLYPACNARASYSSVACPTLQYFSTLSQKGTIFEKEKGNGTQNVCFDFLYKFYPKKRTVILIRIKRDIVQMHIDLHVKCPLFLLDCNKTEHSRQIFEKYSNTKFHENPSSGSRVVPCGRTDGQIDREDEQTRPCS